MEGEQQLRKRTVSVFSYFELLDFIGETES